MANRFIIISLDEALLADLDAAGGNRSVLVGEALRHWLAHRPLAALNEAYADLARLQGGDLAAVGDAAAAKAFAALDG